MRRVTALALCALACAALAAAQPSYWIALNYRVTFTGDGSALVEALFHPFAIDGRSLFGDPDVERNMNSSLTGLANYTLLMFSDNPRLLKHTSFIYEKRLDEVVLCDVANTGVLSEFKGAYVLSARVYLNTSSYVKPLNGSVFEVKVRDSFTSLDVRSWIDVIEFRLEGAKLLSYRWEPPFARGPVEAKEGYLLWVNFNEPQAPDFYVFVLEAPGFTYVGEPPEVNATLTAVEFDGARLKVVVANTGSASGYVYVRAVYGSGEQARKVYLHPSGSREVVFPDVQGASVEVELYSGSALLEKRVAESSAARPKPQPRPLPHLPLFAALLAAAVLGAVYFAKRRRRSAAKGASWQEPTLQFKNYNGKVFKKRGAPLPWPRLRSA